MVAVVNFPASRRAVHVEVLVTDSRMRKAIILAQPSGLYPTRPASVEEAVHSKVRNCGLRCKNCHYPGGSTTMLDWLTQRKVRIPISANGLLEAATEPSYLSWEDDAPSAAAGSKANARVCYFQCGSTSCPAGAIILIDPHGRLYHT